MRILLGSGGFRTGERVAFLGAALRDFFGPLSRLLFVPYAQADHDEYLRAAIDKGWNAGYELQGIHRQSDLQAAVRRACGLFIGGGNTFRLLHDLYRLELLDTIRACVREGLPYLGVSAGTNVACPTIKTTNDMPIVMPASLDALGLVPFQVNPHYVEGQIYVKSASGFEPHFGETRAERILEFHQMNDTPVIGLPEGGFLRVEDRALTLLGTRARIFRKGQGPEDVEAGSRLDDLVGS